MKAILNMKIGPRLMVAFALLLVFMLAIGVMAIVSIQKISDADSMIYSHDLVGISSLGSYQYSFMNLRLASYKLTYTIEDPMKRADELEKVDKQFFSEMDQHLAAFKETRTANDMAKYEELIGLHQRYHKANGDVRAAMRSGEDEETVNSFIAVNAGIAGELNEKLNQFIALSNGEAKTSSDANNTTADTTLFITLLLAAVSLAVGALLSVLITRSITKPVNKLIDGANKMALGEMDFKLDIRSKDEVGTLARAFDNVVQAVSGLVEDAGMLASEAIKGNFNTRADESRHQGNYRKIVDGVNRTLDTIVDKVVWYEALLDAVPMPLSVTDMDMNWTFINRPVEQFLNVKRKDVLGKQCSNWNAKICNTEKCGIARLRSGNIQTWFEQQGMNFQVDTTYITNAKGEKIGHIEVVQDITARSRTETYLKEEVGKIAVALDELAQGNLSFEYSVGEGDQYTKVERESLMTISGNLGSAVSTLRSYIGQITDILGSVANGDISMREIEAFKGDFGGISESLNVITNSFNEVFTEMSTAAEQVAAGTQQVAAGSQALSQGATEQASAIEQLTASLGEIAGQTKQNALSAGQASELANMARDNAVSGNAMMKDMQQAMAAINEASANISRIIKVIDEIAFQTNLLALNAAVEAARAGQHGKGFAVVAEEVRNLAQRSAAAAKETTAMIEESIKRVKAGTKMADETASALNQIVTDVEKATGLVGGIAKASNEQASAIAQVNRGIEQVSQVTQTNSATAEESAAASEELSGQAALVKDMVGRFSLRGQSAASGRKAAFRPAEKAIAEGRPAGKPKIALNDREFGKY